MEKRNATVAVVGAGDFIGGEIAKKFASEGFTVFIGRRQGEKLAPLIKEIEAADGKVFGRALDARKEDEMVSFLGDADKHAPLEVCVFNIGANVNFPIVETTERVFRKVWEMACYSGFLAGREAARLMLPRGKGNIFFTGATASMRGGPGFAAFASAKFENTFGWLFREFALNLCPAVCDAVADKLKVEGFSVGSRVRSPHAAGSPPQHLRAGWLCKGVVYAEARTLVRA